MPITYCDSGQHKPVPRKLVDWNTALCELNKHALSSNQLEAIKSAKDEVKVKFLFQPKLAFVLVSGLISALGAEESDDHVSGVHAAKSSQVTSIDRGTSILFQANLAHHAKLEVHLERVGADLCELIFTRQGDISEDELDALKTSLRITEASPFVRSRSSTSSNRQGHASPWDLLPPPQPEISPWDNPGAFEHHIPARESHEAHRQRNMNAEYEQIKQKLETLGVQVVMLPDSDWDDICGYDDVKRIVEDTVVLPFKHPEVYDKVSDACRAEPVEGKETTSHRSSNRPRAVLFTGNPGVGKTSIARVLAAQSGVPFIHIPIESLSSKWFGEAEKRVAEVLKLIDQIPKAVIFIDEVDALGSSRSDFNTHEASKRMLSVLLRHLDGLESAASKSGSSNGDGSILVAATNRKEALDVAFISRFDIIIHFPLPDLATRRSIFAKYAHHLSPEEIEFLSERSEGLSGRDLRDISTTAERDYASQIIRKKVPENASYAVPFGCYELALNNRLQSHLESYARDEMSKDVKQQMHPGQKSQVV
eukprot:CAMPEP_0184692334 /NCGR_PEP_ID=MMETSP0313-20130426/860_1 /TAXON_ID=2792 /ORGANISM="Porphyridium aerugineum, Strain SAG 1380-2" /LENGTH=535 /DNA_ID=CAMNT_0027150159 /DNA_START=370 /DNA_END=1977 /DNA_ORIENTATION=-